MPGTTKLFERYNYNPTFVETGTLEGHGVKSAIFSGYKTIHSIELADKYYEFCKDYFKYQDFIHIHKGDSQEVLKEVIKGITTPITFWLDAHYSGGDTAFAGVLYPILWELDVIKQHPIKTHTIIIDDMRLMRKEFPAVGFGVEEIKKKILEINPDYSFSFQDGHVADDILVAEVTSQKSFNIIVFSKDRACQLDLFLRSFEKCVNDANKYLIKVLWTASNSGFIKGYQKLFKKYTGGTLNVMVREEDKFKRDVLRLVGNGRYTVFFVDDNVFINPIDFYDRQMMLFDCDPMIICRSLRLKRGLTYCYPSGETMTEPNFEQNMVFDWFAQTGDYGYPLSVDGHIYRTEDILPFIQNNQFSNPNSMEGAWQHGVKYLSKTKMVCYEKAVIVNNPLNRVQTLNKNKCGNVSAEYLNEQFLGGKIISLTTFDGIDNTSCHQEIEIQWEDE